MIGIALRRGNQSKDLRFPLSAAALRATRRSFDFGKHDTAVLAFAQDDNEFVFANRRRIHRYALMLLLCCGAACAQEAVVLPVAPATTQAVAQRFSFASDGPIGPGWTRPDAIARAYFDEELPALFERTLVLDAAVPKHGKLEWIFTGPHAGFTVELTPTKVRVTQRYYDSMGLGGGGGYPERTVREDEQQYVGEARTLTVVMDAHLSVQVRVNGVVMLRQSCLFDVLREQLEFSAPRTEHRVLAGGLLVPVVGEAHVRVDPAVRHQTMLGFGGSPSIPTYARLSDLGKEQYWALLKRYNLLVDREYPMGSELKPDGSNREDLRDATPHYYGDNFPNGEVSDFAYNKRAQEMGGEVIYEMWALPGWAQQPYAGAAVMDAWNKRGARGREGGGVCAGGARLLPRGEGCDRDGAGDCWGAE